MSVSQNNSKTVKAVTLAFCSIQQHSIRNIRARFGIRNLSQSPDIWKNSDGGISNFQISGQSIIKENCHNSRPSDDIHKKLGPVNKLDKRNKTTPKKLDDAVMSENCNVIAVFPIDGQFGAIRKPDLGRIVLRAMFLLIVNFYLTKTENRTKNL